MLFCNLGRIHSDYGDMRHNVYIWRFSCLDYSFDVLVSWSRKLSLYNWLYPHSILSILWCFLSSWDNSGCRNLAYGDVSYMVYIWGFSYLDYFFDVLISRIANVGLYNWFPYSYFIYCLISCSYVLIFMIHLSFTCVPDMHATWNHLLYSLGCIWQLWTHMSRF